MKSRRNLPRRGDGHGGNTNRGCGCVSYRCISCSTSTTLNMCARLPPRRGDANARAIRTPAPPLPGQNLMRSVPRVLASSRVCTRAVASLVATAIRPAGAKKPPATPSTHLGRSRYRMKKFDEPKLPVLIFRAEDFRIARRLRSNRCLNQFFRGFGFIFVF